MTVMTTSMLRRGAFLGLALLLCAGSASAQLYKWVDANGKTHFSDTPPPDNAKSTGTVKGANSATPASDLPYALQNAMKRAPVTLYTDSACSGCDAGRSFLRARGIPFSEKTVKTDADLDRLKAVGGDGSLPYITIGSAKMAGFDPAQWGSMLTSAQYPATKALPSSYQYSAAAPAAPPAAPAPRASEPEAAPAEAPQRTAPEPQAPTPTAPPGFRF
jgi:glutaredoxin